jgi:hypothetical protein
MNPFLGVFFHGIGGFAAGSFYFMGWVPLRWGDMILPVGACI